MKSFANIGKGVLIKALGIQQNHKIVTQEKQTFTNTCLHCECYLLSNCGNCPSCPYYQTHQSYTYVNEKNMYGYQERLSGNALKLFLYYHLSGPDKNGIIKHVSFSDAAEQLDCSVKTIKNNHDTLVEYGYIMSCSDPDDPKFVTIYLPEYKKYFASGKNGGHGYLTISDTLAKELFKIDNVNALRLTLRGVLNCDVQNNNKIVSRNYEELKRYLPRYFTRNLIQKALADNPVLDIEMDDTQALFFLQEKYKGKETKTKVLKENEVQIQQYVTIINTYLSLYNNNPKFFSQKLGEEGIYLGLEDLPITPALSCSEQDLKDLALVSLDTGLSRLLDILGYIYQYFVLANEKINSIGALARSIAKDTGQNTA